MRFWLDMGVDGLRMDAIPYLVERDGTSCENLPETHRRHQVDSRSHRRRIRQPTDSGRSKSVACRRASVFRRWRRMPHGISFSSDAAHLHGASSGRSASDHRHHGADSADSGQLPMGPVPSQSRRVDARDGHRRRARLHVLRLLGGSAHAHQRRYPAKARSAGR